MTWLKDGLVVENNPDYQTSFENGLCCLIIEETFSDDSAKFTCQATNSAGIAHTEATLQVLGTSSIEFYYIRINCYQGLSHFLMYEMYDATGILLNVVL